MMLVDNQKTTANIGGGMIRLAFLAAAVATLCDAMHVQTQTLSYPAPFFFGQAAFVFPGFVGAFTVMAISYWMLASRLPASIPRDFSTTRGSAGELTESLVTFALVYLLSAYGNRTPLVLALLFYSTAMLRIGMAQDRKFLTLMAFLLAVMGMLAEGTMTQLNLVHYREPEIYGVPVWLGALYMHGAFALRDGMRYFVYHSNERTDDLLHSGLTARQRVP